MIAYAPLQIVRVMNFFVIAVCHAIVPCVFNASGPCHFMWSPVKPKHNVLNEEY